MLAPAAAWPDRYPCLLESVVHGTAQSRYDILFALPQASLTLQGDGSLRGKLALLIFTSAGKIDFKQSRVLSVIDGCLGMDIPPGVWHSLVALEDAVIYEVKGQPAGGYVQADDKDFAPWSPEEGSGEADEYCRILHEAALTIR